MNTPFANPMNPINPMAGMQNLYGGVNPYMNRPVQTYQQPQNNGIIWVQGIEGAKAYHLEANSNVILLDSENEGRFYIKTSDNVGMCSLRTFGYTEITDQPTAKTDVDMSQYVTREELNNLLAQLGGNSDGEQSVSTTKSTKSGK
ncbi:MAG: hypothetical protein J1F01_08595 [Oscillospiraceae bacterium]|nr:hypothetical protein [Oscillospiraceae bacterium]